MYVYFFLKGLKKLMEQNLLTFRALAGLEIALASLGFAFSQAQATQAPLG